MGYNRFNPAGNFNPHVFDKFAYDRSLHVVYEAAQWMVQYSLIVVDELK